MGYIGYCGDWPEVSSFNEDNLSLPDEHIKWAVCHWMPEQQQFHFIFCPSSHWYRYFEGRLFKTDPTEFLKYADRDAKIDSEFLNGRYCNQDRLIAWAQRCVSMSEDQ